MEEFMKIKKTFLALALAFCLIVPTTFVMTACGHKHTYSQDWSADAEYHWHDCTGKKCNEVDSKAKHDYTDDSDATCNTCGHERTLPAHTHSFAEVWTTDADYHWHVCTGGDCNEVGSKAQHDYTDDNDKTCNTCNYERVAKENVLTANIQPRTYSCQTQGLVQGTDFTTTHGTAKVTYKLKGSTDAFSVVQPKNAGTYVAKIVVAGNAIYKSLDEEVEFTIQKFNILEKENQYPVYYSGKTTGDDAAFNLMGNYEIYKKFAPDRLRVKFTFPSANAGTRSTSAELYTNCEDKSVLNNYNFDASKAYAIILKKTIYLGKGSKDANLNVSNNLEGGFDLMSLAALGAVEGDDVALQINGTTHGLVSGSKIKIVARQSDYVAGENYLATLTGEKASNYELWDFGNATYTERATTYVGQVRNDRAKSFGATDDAIKYGENHFVVNQNSNDYRTLIYTAGNEDKQVTISVYTASGKLIAQIKRVGIKSLSDMQFKYLGGSLNVDEGSADFKLLKNVDGFTDEQGRWICKTPSITLEMVLEFEDVKVIETSDFGTAFGSGKLLTGTIYVIKVNSDSSDYAIKLNYDSLQVNIKVYNAYDNGNGRDEGDELTYDAEEGGCYSDAVYFYVEVLEGSDSATITVELIEF